MTRLDDTAAMKRITLLAAAWALALGLGVAAGPLAAHAADGDPKNPLKPGLARCRHQCAPREI